MRIEENETYLIGVLVNSVIAAAAIATLIYQRIFNTRTLDYNLHPVFKITDFCPECTKYWTPKLCESAIPNSKHFCPNDHWFDVTNLSNGPAFELQCYLIHKSEITDKFHSKNFIERTASRQALIYKGTLQYKIPIDTIPFKHYNKSSTEQFFIILSYKTANITSKFIQIVSLNSNPVVDKNQIKDWKGSIELSLPQVQSLRKIHWWENENKILIQELDKIE